MSFDNISFLENTNLSTNFLKLLPEKEVIEASQASLSSEEKAFFLQERGEPLSFCKEKLLFDIARAEDFEDFLHKKYPGQKRFSLEGCEVLIPLLLDLSEREMDALFIGMSHRGRLNVMAHLLEKPYEEIFSQFEEKEESSLEQGDVKYHQGYKKNIKKGEKELLVVLSPNPSHLESVFPVILGKVRAWSKKNKGKKSFTVVMHGDGSLAGQGVIYESMQLSGLASYKTSGVLHLCIDNQIAFTTDPKDSRCTSSPVDIAKTFSIPVLEIEGSDPEKALKAVDTAYKYIKKFKKDIFIRIKCYRKYGHNEGDEPFFTHPLEYTKIRENPPLYTQFLKKLINEKALTEKEAIDKKETLKNVLEDSFKKAKENTVSKSVREKIEEGNLSFVPEEALFQEIEKALNGFPVDFSFHSKLQNLLEERKKSLRDPLLKNIDFGWAEGIALSFFLTKGKSVRLTGQDVIRGTFSHRHAAFFDQKTGESFFPLKALCKGDTSLEVVNSPLSEYAAMGFEWGYSTFFLEGITLWEAQFGDFANGAQVIIDQYLSSSEVKWGEKGNLIVLLPHGFEGQGPEHSSARIERFLSLAASDNMLISIPTNAAQYFHLLVDTLNHPSKPQIIFTPKSLLRMENAKTSLKELQQGKFTPFLEKGVKEAETVIFTFGKGAYELEARLAKEGLKAYIVQIERLYPFEEEILKKMIGSYSEKETYLFYQEEPENMGAIPFLLPLLTKIVGKKIEPICRKMSASPATGFKSVHEKEKEALLQKVCALCTKR